MDRGPQRRQSVHAGRPPAWRSSRRGDGRGDRDGYASSVPRSCGPLAFPNPSGVIGTVGMDEACRQPVLPGARDQRTDLRDVSSAGAGLEHHAGGAARSLRAHGRTRPDLPHQRRLELRRPPTSRRSDARRRAFSLLLQKGLIRIALDAPGRAEFDIIEVDDPYRCGGPLTAASMYRRPLPSANVKFLSAVMWDGRRRRLARRFATD